MGLGLERPVWLMWWVPSGVLGRTKSCIHCRILLWIGMRGSTLKVHTKLGEHIVITVHKLMPLLLFRTAGAEPCLTSFYLGYLDFALDPWPMRRVNQLWMRYSSLMQLLKRALRFGHKTLTLKESVQALMEFTRLQLVCASHTLMVAHYRISASNHPALCTMLLGQFLLMLD